MAIFLLARRLALLGLVTGWLAGCETIDADQLTMSSAPPELSAPAASSIAGDMVTKLAEQVAPATGTILLASDGSSFSQALEMSLKSWGYAVATDQKAGDTKMIKLAYVIEPFEGQILVRLSTGDIELGRAYSQTAAGAAPASPLSIMRRG